MSTVPGRDPGLRASPWVSVEIGSGSVTVDGVAVQADGTPEGRYLAALQQVADDVAAPLGRRVGVTVTGATGVVAHLAVRPDGTVDSIEELVHAAHAPTRPRDAASPVASVSGTRAVVTGSEVASPPARGRRTLVVASVVLLAAAAVVVAPVVNGRDGELASSTSGDPVAETDDAVAAAGPGEAAAQAPAATSVAVRHFVLASPVLHRRVRLTARVVSPAPGRVRLRLPATVRLTRAEVRLRAADGRVVVRRLRLAPGRAGEVDVSGLAPGLAVWSVTAPAALPASGRIRVMAWPPPTPAPPPPAPPSSTPPGSAPPTAPAAGGQPSSGGGGNGSGGGHSSPDPVVPIDPDDP